MDHWPALPSASPMPPGGQLGGGKSSKVEWGVTEREKAQREEEGAAEGDLQLLMRSLDIAEHLHVLKVYIHVHVYMYIQIHSV